MLIYLNPFLSVEPGHDDLYQHCVLQGVGVTGMIIGSALVLPPASSSGRMPGGIRRRSQAGRQIAGTEPHRSDEVAQLRLFAECVVASSRTSPAHGVMAFGAVSTFVGAVCSLPNAYASDVAAFIVDGVALGVVVMVAVALFVHVRRLTRRGIANAEDFLRRTQPVADSMH